MEDKQLFEHGQMAENTVEGPVCRQAVVADSGLAGVGKRLVSRTDMSLSLKLFSCLFY